MKVRSVFVFLALVALIQAAGSTPAHAWTDEQLANRGNRVVTTSPVVSVAADALLVLRQAGAKAGVASEISQIERIGSTLVLGLADGESLSVPYLNEANAEAAYRAIRQGASIDASSCLEKDAVISSRSLDQRGCVATEYTVRVSCGLLDSTPLLVGVNASSYSLVGVGQTGLTQSSVSCRMHPGRI